MVVMACYLGDLTQVLAYVPEKKPHPLNLAKNQFFENYLLADGIHGIS